MGHGVVNVDECASRVVLVCLSCHNKTAQTDGLNNRHLFFLVLEAAPRFDS